jgi:hypothetical protein
MVKHISDTSKRNVSNCTSTKPPLTASKIVTESVRSDEKQRTQNSKVEGMNEKGESIKVYASPFVFGPPPLVNPAECKPRAAYPPR